MLPSLRAGLATGLLLVAAGLPLVARDSTMMKKDAVGSCTAAGARRRDDA